MSYFIDEYGMEVDRLDGFGRLSPGRKPGFTFKGGLWFADAFTCGNYSTPSEAPYSYGVHVVNGPVKEFKGEGIQCNYSDRIVQWKGHAKWKRGLERIKDKLNGPGHKAWSYTSLTAISEFLSFMYGYKVECLQVLEGCNVGNGYPYVIFVTKRVHKPRKKKAAN